MNADQRYVLESPPTDQTLSPSNECAVPEDDALLASFLKTTVGNNKKCQKRSSDGCMAPAPKRTKPSTQHSIPNKSKHVHPRMDTQVKGALLSIVLYAPKIANTRSKFLLTGFVPIFFCACLNLDLILNVFKILKNDRQMLLSIKGSSFSGSELAQSLSKGAYIKKNIVDAFIECKNFDNKRTHPGYFS
jgi:hypothetical protein